MDVAFLTKSRYVCLKLMKNQPFSAWVKIAQIKIVIRREQPFSSISSFSANGDMNKNVMFCVKNPEAKRLPSVSKRNYFYFKLKNQPSQVVKKLTFMS